ncbi:MAG: Uma2 family endonuclease [Candidatus Xenobia bacterium]
MSLRQGVSLEEFLRWPEEKPYLEYINGAVNEKAMGNAEHSLLQLELGRLLARWDAEGFVMTEPRCLLQAHGRTQVVLPDVAWFRAGTLILNARKQAIVAPQLAVEVVSPDDSYSRVEEKVAVYLEAGSPLVWVVDPTPRKVTVHRKGGSPVVLTGDASLQDPLLPGFSLPLPELFRKLDLLPPGQGDKQP